MDIRLRYYIASFVNIALINMFLERMNFDETFNDVMKFDFIHRYECLHAALDVNEDVINEALDNALKSALFNQHDIPRETKRDVIRIVNLVCENVRNQDWS